MNATGTITPFSISAYKSNEAGPSPQLIVSSDKYAVSADKAMLFEVYEEAWTVGLLHCWSAIKEKCQNVEKMCTSFSKDNSNLSFSNSKLELKTVYLNQARSLELTYKREGENGWISDMTLK